MLKRTISYVDYDGNERTEDFYFHLTKAEVIEWLMTTGDYTLDKVLERIAAKRNGKEIMATFRDLIYKSYGEKSLDGRRFIKTEEVKQAFMETEAYSILFIELVSDGKKAGEFVNGIIPKELADEIARIAKENPDGLPDAAKDYIPIVDKNGSEIKVVQ